MVNDAELAVHSIVLEDPPLNFDSQPKVNKQLVVFDFDWTFADQDTDRWVHEVLSPRLRIEFVKRKPTMQFTDMCAYLLQELHKEGHSRAEVEDALRRMPLHPAMIRGVRTLQAKSTPNTDFLLLSNSNQVYIDTILEHNHLLDPPLFKEVITNPAHFEPSGLLRLRRRIAPDQVQHACKVGCSANMCKGDELKAFLNRHTTESYERIIYVGDGGNDYCPVLRLNKNDMALVRRHRGLAKRILEEGQVQCNVRYWSGAWEAEQWLEVLAAC
ncbi:pyridoxal phosphatase [Malassezia yamatoensis]|uniref:Pyridoxal phosphatase n=1 Tax=Malassezia yamatoensis TaxID=253288 RepID=A0AAJ5YV75_9BASI|nr:pyridoxal phosphatase [Malassezia yamatoensis]